MEPIFVAATRVLADVIPDLVTWIATKLANREDPEAELRAMMAAAEAEARELERQKFGGG